MWTSKCKRQCNGYVKVDKVIASMNVFLGSYWLRIIDGYFSQQKR